MSAWFEFAASAVSSGAFWWPLLVLTSVVLAYNRAGVLLWLPCGTIALSLFSFYATDVGWLGKAIAWLVFVVSAVILAVPPVRRRLLTHPVLEVYRAAMPAVSEVDRVALEAGTVGWDGELFSGRPRWRRMFQQPAASLPVEERAFLDDSVERLCAIASDYRTDDEIAQLPAAAWQFLRDDGYFGLTIPEAYGGLGFSSCGVAAVVMTLATRSANAAVTVAVTNLMGPVRLLLDYGTDEQKKRWLPALADGKEIPCFALSGPETGSDAAGVPDRGVVAVGEYDGHENVLGVRMTFDKRYVTLGPVASIIGVVFRLYDPDGLLGDKPDMGITVALVPSNTRR